MSIVNGYATQSAVKVELGITDTAEDAKVDAAINAASRQIDAHTGRRFWQDSTVKVRTYYAEERREVEVDDISTTTGLVVKTDDNDDGTFPTTLTINTNFTLLPLNAAAETPVWPYTCIRIVDSLGTYFPIWTSGRPGVQVTAKFGWPAVPDDVEKACVVQARQLFKASAQTFGAFALGPDGNAMRVLPLDPIARGLLERYVKVQA